MSGRCVPSDGEGVTQDGVLTDAAGDSGSEPTGPDTPQPDTPVTGDLPPDTPTGECTNGQTQACYTGPVGTKDIGECKSGTQTCTAGQWGPCENEVNPDTELCDGKDNNCDGQIDEATPTLGQACQAGQGECQTTGKFVCKADGSDVECDAKPSAPTTEICDAKDNDCDGQIDEGCKCKNGDTQSCYSGKAGCTSDGKKGFNCTSPCKASTQTCNGNSWGTCENEALPTTELCNSLDDDCDGQVDNGFTDKGKECTVGQGPCASKGKLVCNGDGSGLECDAKAGAGSKELCNGKDDDCDGQTDEDFTTLGQNCSIGAAPCLATGKFVCLSDGSGVECDAGKPTGTKETCNGQDDDCDGQTDEDFPTKGNTCTGGTSSCPTTGQLVCKADGSGVECNAGSSAGSKELCNGKDDDCDGQTDEDFPSKGQTCGAGQGECANTGKIICKADGTGVMCNASPKEAKLEECNGKDDDCDGQIDESLVRDCKTGNNDPNKGICRAGLQTCNNGSWGSCQGQVTKQNREQCIATGSNVARDEDCDEQIDEGCSCRRNDSRSCGTDVGECQKGTQRCTGSGINRSWGACTNQVKPVEEKCDGKDNDCDGRTDENFPSKGQSCSVGIGACRVTGTLVCKADGSGLECDAKAKAAGTEVCDGIDNNCNGEIDENCP